MLARIDLTATYIDAQTGTVRESFARYRSLLERPGLSPETQGMIWSQLALMHKYVGDHRAALADYTTAIDLLRGQRRDEPGPAQPSQPPPASRRRGPGGRRPDDGGRPAKDEDAPERRARALHNLGYARLLTGDLVGALQAMDGARPVLAPLSPVSRAVGDHDRAEVLTAAGGPAMRSWRCAECRVGVRRPGAAVTTRPSAS